MSKQKTHHRIVVRTTSNLSLRTPKGSVSSQPVHVYRALIVVAPLGVLAGVALTFAAPWEVAVLTGWDIMALLLLLRIRGVVWNMSARDTARLARIEDPSRGLADSVLVIASVMCIVGVGYTLRMAGQSHGFTEVGLTAIAVISLICSWLIVHVVFMLRYARLYYSDHDGGIEFNEDGAPQYTDFAYFAFTIGMTFQVSDTNIEEKTIRKSALHHALLSYLFGAVILAMVVNVGASLLK
jgi:uncharacterized membrane protein